MPFSTDTNWPQDLPLFFDVCRKARDVPFETRYDSVHQDLIFYALDITSDFSFQISLPPTRDESSLRGSFSTFRVVKNLKQEPVLIMDMRDDTWADTPDKRQRADTLMRERYNQMLHQCPMPHLYGLSFMGPSLRVYRGDKATGDITPEFVDCPSPNKVLPRDFLEGQWVNVLSQEGFTKIQEVVTYINTETHRKVKVVE
jgi:hypothetical protein